MAAAVAAAVAELVAVVAGTRKRSSSGSCEQWKLQSGMGNISTKRPRKTADGEQLSDSSLMCVAVDHDEMDVNGAKHLGSVRVWIMETHPQHCELSPWLPSYHHTRCNPIKALQRKDAIIHAVRAPDDECGIAIHINGVLAAAFDRERKLAFMAAMDAGQIILDGGIAKTWMEVDFDVLAGPANQAATVPPEVQACEGFERGVLARDRTCDGNDCPCC